MCPWLFFQETWIENWYAHTHTDISAIGHIYIYISYYYPYLCHPYSWYTLHISFLHMYIYIYWYVVLFHRQHVSWSSIQSKVPPKARKASPSSCVETRFSGGPEGQGCTNARETTWNNKKNIQFANFLYLNDGMMNVPDFWQGGQKKVNTGNTTIETEDIEVSGFKEWEMFISWSLVYWCLLYIAYFEIFLGSR